MSYPAQGSHLFGRTSARNYDEAAPWQAVLFGEHFSADSGGVSELRSDPSIGTTTDRDSHA